MINSTIVSFIVIAIAACGSQAPVATSPSPTPGSQDLLARELAAFAAARPALEGACARCHTKSGAKATEHELGHFDMTTYPFAGEHARSIGNEIRAVLAIDGAKAATMPDDKPGSLNADDLRVIVAWTEAWRAAGRAGIHPADAAVQDDD